MPTVPSNPIDAVTHADPYPYYADLVARTQIYRDDALGLWVASSAEAVTAVLTSDLCRVRPAAEPVPRALIGSPAGEIFGRLVRMNDGIRHDPLKDAVTATLAPLPVARIDAASQDVARALWNEVDRGTFAFHLPVYVVASMLGVPGSRLRETAEWTGDFVWCLAPVARPEQVARGKVAAGHLLELFRSLVRDAPAPAGLLAALTREAAGGGVPDAEVVAANGVGFLFQAYEATAGLIGNTLIALAARPALRAQAAADPAVLRACVQEALRYDSPIQNTRRFIARSGAIAEQAMREGDAVLVVLAAANRDPAANADPDRFDVSRGDRRVFTFSAGAHACPGEVIATSIAVAGVAEWLRSGVDLGSSMEPIAYRPSANARVPLFRPS